MKSPISFVQSVMIMMLSTGLLNHVIIIPILLDAAGRDAWMSIVLAGICSLAWIAVLRIGIRQVNKQPIFEMLSNAYPPFVGKVLAGAAGIYLFVICTLTTRDTVYWIHLTFSPETPIVVFTLIFLLISVVNAYLGIQSIANTASILLPIVVLLGFFVMFSNTPHKDYSLLKPFLAHGMQPVWNGVIYVGAGFVEIIMLLFMQHHIQSRLMYMHLLILIVILAGLTIGPLIGGIVEFGVDEADKLRYPAYEEWRLLTIGRYIEHMDFFSVYQWFSGAFIRMSITMFLILDVFRIQSNKGKAWVLGCLYAAILFLASIPISDQVFMRTMSSYVLPFSFWGVLLYSVVVVGLILLARLRGRTVS
ncbi:endospore germination permease [Paenibacillus sp. Y412MC10]|uniref:GerAB/ArcD/ProY family transporter n=1 Tax=Geobacillus sp. (strain Y412MC10) TaxID=481743 RepID=UPI0011AB1EBF|nr:endospore germination permease [Paenibacillus sp. Y412MC10]